MHIRCKMTLYDSKMMQQHFLLASLFFQQQRHKFLDTISQCVPKKRKKRNLLAMEMKNYDVATTYCSNALKNSNAYQEKWFSNLNNKIAKYNQQFSFEVLHGWFLSSFSFFSSFQFFKLGLVLASILLYLSLSSPFYA